MPPIEFIDCPEALSRELGHETPSSPVAVVFSPLDYKRPPAEQSPGLSLVDRLFEQVIVISHAAASGLDYRHPQHMDERRIRKRTTSDSVSKFWRQWESSARKTVSPEKLLILRLPFLVFPGANDALNHALEAKCIPRRPAFDCAFQVVSKEQLTAILRLVIRKRLKGVYNCTPPGVVHASSLARMENVRSKNIVGRNQGSLCGIKSISSEWWRLFRFPCTLDSSKFEKDTGIDWSSFPSPLGIQADGDPFGLTPQTVHGTFWHHAAARRYWRMHVSGEVEIPETGSAILIGPHRGFMPYDAVMMAYWMAVTHGRIPRYLVHHCLLRYPLLGQYIRRMGGMPACQENAMHTLRSGEILAVFPEGIQGTFRFYRQTYTLGSFGRGDYLRWALETDSPILPYVCTGPQEAYPIFFKINWTWWKRMVEWPAFPITATFPVIPLPLPTKWHFQFLPTIHPKDRFPGLEPDDEQGVRKASKIIRAELQEEMFKLKARRKNWFTGSLRTEGPS